MGPRFIESKKRGKSGILTGKGNRNVRKKLIHKKPSERGIANNDATSQSTKSINTEPRSKNFIGGELLETSDPLLDRADDGKRSTKQASENEDSRPGPKLARPSRSLGFDTRTLLDAKSGERYGSIAKDMNKFMEHLRIRGYNVPVVSSTVLDSSKRAKIRSVEKESGATREISYASAVGVKTSTNALQNPLDDAPIEAKVAVQNTSAKLEEIPNTLTADFTWNLVADLGTSIVKSCHIY